MGSFSRIGPLGQRRQTAVPGAQFAPPSIIQPYSVLLLPGPWTLDLKTPAMLSLLTDLETDSPFSTYEGGSCGRYEDPITCHG